MYERQMNVPFFRYCRVHRIGWSYRHRVESTVRTWEQETTGRCFYAQSSSFVYRFCPTKSPSPQASKIHTKLGLLDVEMRAYCLEPCIPTLGGKGPGPLKFEIRRSNQTQSQGGQAGGGAVGIVVGVPRVENDTVTDRPEGS
jgi:hypothetical protein